MLTDIDHREIKRQNKINKYLQSNNSYSKLGIIEDVTSDDVSISLSERKIYITSKITQFGFITYMYKEWYSNPSLQKLPLPVKLNISKIDIYHNWEIDNEEYILLPSDARKIWEKQMNNKNNSIDIQQMIDSKLK